MAERLRTGTSLEEFISQQDAFDSLPPEVDTILRFFEENVRKPDAMKDFMVNYTDLLLPMEIPTSRACLREKPTIAGLIDNAKE